MPPDPMPPVIVLGEYRHGLRGSKLRRKLEAHLDAFSRTVDILPVREPTTRFYADIRQELKAVGRPIPENDIWIAALSREYGFSILSMDAHFDAIKNIGRVGW